MLSTADTNGTIIIVGAGRDINNYINGYIDQQEMIRALQILTAAPPHIEIDARPEPLMYKGWMSPEQYGKYLYLQLFKSKVKSIKAKGHNYIGDLKTFRRYQRR